MLLRLTYSNSKIIDSVDSANLFSTGQIDSSGAQPPLLQPFDEFEKVKRLKYPPIRLFDQLNISVQFGFAEIVLCLLGHVDTDYPAQVIIHVLGKLVCRHDRAGLLSRA